jgi:hypothetical protein
LIEKAATSPFALLSAAFGGGQELSYLEFQPGRSDLTDKDTKKLDTLAKALYERPAVSLEISGACAPATDREALARVRLDEQLNAEWLQEQSPAARSNLTVATVILEPKERERLVRRAYRKTIGTYRPSELADTAAGATNLALANPSVPQKSSAEYDPLERGAMLLLAQTPKPPPIIRPTTVDGQKVLKELSPRDAELADMEDQLARRIQITDDDLRELMQARANTVQHYLLQTGKVTGERLFITAPRPVSDTAKGESRVNLSLN